MSLLPLDLGMVAISPDEEREAGWLPHFVGQLIDGGLTSFMFREKRLADGEFVDLARKINSLCQKRGVGFILNERWELAEPIGTSNVHLTWKSRPMSTHDKVRGLTLGKSVHGIEEAIQAQQESFDYLVAGPVLDTPSKRGLVSPLGFETFEQLVRRVEIPVVALGGLTLESVPRVRKTGARGMAGISCFFGSDHPEAAVSELKKAWWQSK